MSNFSNMNTQKQNSLIQKVEAKLSVLQNFIECSEVEFVVPKRFSYNWFVSLSEGSLVPFSKASKGVSPGTELRKRIDWMIAEANAKLKRDSRTCSNEPEKITELRRLNQKFEAENKQLKLMLDNRTDENVHLRRQLADAKRNLEIARAAWNDQKQADSKTKRLKS